VTGNKPKMLSGLDQKVCGQASGIRSSPIADGAPPAEAHDLTPESIEKVNEVTPVVCPQGKADRKGGRSGSGGGMREEANAVR
jgi:hypothetical protein